MSDLPVWWQNVYPSLELSLQQAKSGIHTRRTMGGVTTLHNEWEQVIDELLWLAPRLNAFIDDNLILDDDLEIRRRNLYMLRVWYEAACSVADFSVLERHALKHAFIRVRNLLERAND